MRPPLYKNVALLGLLTALGMMLGYIEMLFPISLGVPGVKIGFANLVTLIALYKTDNRQVLILTLLRVTLVAATFGNMAAFFYSLSGALLSAGVMMLLKKHFHLLALSAVGGVMHNAGQILVAMVILETPSLVYYLPVLIVAGVLAGLATGSVAGGILKRLPEHF